MAKEAILKNEDGTILYPRTISSVVLDAETGEPIGKVYTKNIKADDEKKWLRVEGEEGKRYFVALTELSAPNAPTIEITIYDVVKDSFDILVKNNTTGATMEYKIGESDTWKQIPNDNKITCNTGYTDDNENWKIYLKIYLRATKNGEESDENIVDITVNPKVASGSVAVVRTSNWSTVATINLSPSQTTGAKSEYSTDSGVSWTELSGAEIIEVSTSEDTPKTISPGTYKVRASKEGGVYVPAKEAENGEFTIGARKAYYGASSKATLNLLSDIQSLKNKKEWTKFKESISFTAAESGYVWLCSSGTLGQVASDANFMFPAKFDKVSSSVEGYNTYRSQFKVDKGTSHTFYFK